MSGAGLNTHLNLHLIHLTDMKDFVDSELKALEEGENVCIQVALQLKG